VSSSRVSFYPRPLSSRKVRFIRRRKLENESVSDDEKSIDSVESFSLFLLFIMKIVDGLRSGALSKTGILASVSADESSKAESVFMLS